ncbi:MAG TPA: RHS repeat-associated core domain-containing protein [Blastocatellia bacterium]|nr:RHS repeat-associated core domain-containing protein [Blastocatellia bacterium]
METKVCFCWRLAFAIPPNSSGVIVSSDTSDSFGNLTASTGSTTNPFRYTGREFDTETSLYYYRARYYDVAIGRFAAEDLEGFDAGINFYAYVQNHPTDFVDPTGQKKNCITRIMLVTAYCAKGPGSDWQHFKPKKRGGKPGSVGPGTVAVANSDPQPYPFGCSVTVSGANGQPEYKGETHDTGAGWDPQHHDVLPGQWIDIWKSSCRKAWDYGVQYRNVTICCENCNFEHADLPY